MTAKPSKPERAEEIAKRLTDDWTYSSSTDSSAIARALRKAKAVGLRDAADCCDALLKYPKAVSATKRELAKELAEEFRRRADAIARVKA